MEFSLLIPQNLTGVFVRENSCPFLKKGVEIGNDFRTSTKNTHPCQCNRVLEATRVLLAKIQSLRVVLRVSSSGAQ